MSGCGARSCSSQLRKAGWGWLPACATTGIHTADTLWGQRLELGEAGSEDGGKTKFPKTRNTIPSITEWPGLEGTIKIISLPWAGIHPCSKIPPFHTDGCLAAFFLWSSGADRLGTNPLDFWQGGSPSALPCWQPRPLCSDSVLIPARATAAKASSLTLPLSPAFPPLLITRVCDRGGRN